MAKKMRAKKMKVHNVHGAHTGPIHHPHMTSHLMGMGGKDPHADPLHHEANMAMGGHEGLSPQGGYDSASAEGEPTQGEGGANAEMC